MAFTYKGNPKAMAARAKIMAARTSPVSAPVPRTTNLNVGPGRNVVSRPVTQAVAPIVNPAQRNVPQAIPRTFKNGGNVQKSGTATVHKGEKVLTKSQAANYKTSGKKGK
jgi:hypothetical protein